MDPLLLQMLRQYSLNSGQDYENALKEIIQQVALLGLWRTKFYEHAAFYGGTALRILYGLRRFSEDIDFSLMEPKENFTLDTYIYGIEKELSAVGFHVEVAGIGKEKQTSIESAFIKGNSRKNLIYVNAPDEVLNGIPFNKKLKIKLEVDTDPPSDAEFEVKNLLNPIPFSVRSYTLPCLFAGKLHALMCRKWKNRVKGRDYYDFVWYISQDVPCHLTHLKARMVQTGHLNEQDFLDLNTLKDLLVDHFSKVDFEQAARDVEPFIKDRQELDLWSKEFFVELTGKLKSEQ